MYGELGKLDKQCKQPCDKMLVYFGFPFFSDTSKPKGYVKIYLKRVVKEIEDFQDYTLLRSQTISLVSTYNLVLPPHFRNPSEIKQYLSPFSA